MSAPVRLDNVLRNLKENRVPKNTESQKSLEDAVDTTATSAPAAEPQAAAAEPAPPEPQAPAAPAKPSTVPAEIADARPPESGLPAKMSALGLGEYGAKLHDLDSLWRFAVMVEMSGLAPKGMEKRASIAVAIQLGLELGLPPMAALQNIAVINGRPGIYGDAALALVLASGLCEFHKETYEGTGENREAICETKRRGSPESLVTRFSVADARRAGLWGKTGPWTQYPDRMLRFRARGFNIRDNFADVLKGFRTAEEIQDIGDMTEIEAEPGPIEMPRRASELAPAEPQA